MGGSNSLVRSQSQRSDCSDDPLGDYLPEDLVVEILSYVPATDLLINCMHVCQQWKNIICEHGVWKRKCEREGKIIPPFVFHNIPEHYYRLIYLRNPYGRNLLKNPCGEDNFDHWIITQNNGHEWAIENPPQGADAVPKEVGSQSCFATSYGVCEKYQVIDLTAEGVSPEVIETIHPDILIGEWHAARFDCGSRYELTVRLMDENEDELKSFRFGPFIEEQWAGSAWSKVSEVIKDYPPGLRYIVFMHSGVDTQFWAGHFGSKMTGGYVKFKID